MPKQLSGSTRQSDISVESTNSVDYSSLNPLRERLVDPDISVASPSHRRSRSILFRSCLAGVVLAAGTSAVIAFRQFSLADIWRDHISSWAQLHRPTLTMRGEQAIPQLIVQSSRGHAGEPIPLGLTIHGPAEGAVIIITGLLPGMELSNGIEVDVDRWEVPATDVSYAWIAPRDGFVGSAALTAELRLTDDSIADRQAIHLEWVRSSPPGSAENQYNREEAAGPIPPVLAGERDLEKAAIAVSPSLAPEQGDRQEVPVSSSPPVLASERDLEKAAIAVSPSLAPEQGDRQELPAVSPSLAPEQGDRREVPVSSSPPVLASERIPSSPSLARGQVGREEAVASLPAFAQRQLDREEVTVLLKWGKDLIANGDIAAARLILKRAADANNAEAALALAATYDPFVLRELKVYGFTPDAAMARIWYEKATELGSPAAPRRLEMLTQGTGTR
jgi:TPR repeat protein